MNFREKIFLFLKIVKGYFDFYGKWDIFNLNGFHSNVFKMFDYSSSIPPISPFFLRYQFFILNRSSLFFSFRALNLTLDLDLDLRVKNLSLSLDSIRIPTIVCSISTEDVSMVFRVSFSLFFFLSIS